MSVRCSIGTVGRSDTFTFGRVIGAAAIGIITMVAVMALAQLPAAVRGFTVPAAFGASLFLSAPLSDHPDGPLVHTSPPILVVPACSGMMFFGVLTSLIVFLAVMHRPRTAVIYPLIIPLAYCITVAANALRLVSAWYAGLFTASAYPAVGRIVHEWTGMLIFIPVLIAAYHLAERRFRHEENGEKERKSAGKAHA